MKCPKGQQRLSEIRRAVDRMGSKATTYTLNGQIAARAETVQAIPHLQAINRTLPTASSTLPRRPCIHRIIKDRCLTPQLPRPQAIVVPHRLRQAQHVAYIRRLSTQTGLIVQIPPPQTTAEDGSCTQTPTHLLRRVCTRREVLLV